MSTNLPREILWEILLKLPVKSLCRFKCVSRSLNSIISDPDFIEQHLKLSTLSPSLLLCVIDPHPYRMASFCSLEYGGHLGRNESMQAHRLGSHEAPAGGMFWNREFVQPLQSVAGLVMLRVREPSEMEMAIYNPATRVSVAVIPYTGIYSKIFLGFDHEVRTHKLLAVHQSEVGKRIKNGYEVLTLDNERNWRTVSGGSNSERRPFQWVGECFCFRGVIYFAGVTDGASYLYGFRVRQESFQSSIPLPMIDAAVFRYSVVGSFAGRLAVCADLHWSCGEVHLWVSDPPQARQPVSWPPFLKISRPASWSNFTLRDDNICLRGITPAGELVFSQLFPRPYVLLFYHVDSGRTRTVRVPEVTDLLEAACQDDPFCRKDISIPLATDYVCSLKALKD